MGFRENVVSNRLRSPKNGIPLTGKAEKESKIIQHEQLYHKIRDSLFSLPSTHVKYDGIFNLCIILMVLSNLYVALENIKKYGLLINPLSLLHVFFAKSLEMKLLPVWLGLNIFPVSSLSLEILLFKGVLGAKVGLTLITLSLTLLLLIPPFAVFLTDCYAVAFFVVVGYIIVFLKLVSYHMVNYQHLQSLRSASETHQHGALSDAEIKDGTATSNLVCYPNNLNFKGMSPSFLRYLTSFYLLCSYIAYTGAATLYNPFYVLDLFYFIFVPTLCYEVNFPCLPSIRKKFLVKSVFESVFLLLLSLSIIQQSIAPVVIDALKSIQVMGYLEILETYLRITLPFAVVFPCYFYMFFHSYLNVIAEILRFGDRQFYGDWWNCDGMACFWRKWNTPVHRWCARHVYVHVLKLGFSKFQAVYAVFVVSAFFHEYLASVPVKHFIMWIFFGYQFQVLSFTNFGSNSSFSLNNNSSIWMSFMFFQPLTILLFYYFYFT